MIIDYNDFYVSWPTTDKWRVLQRDQPGITNDDPFGIFESRIAKFTSVLPLVIPKLEDIFEKSAILIQNNNNRKITNWKNRGPDNTNRTQLRSCCSPGLCKSSVLSVLFIVLFVRQRNVSLRSIPVIF